MCFGRPPTLFFSFFILVDVGFLVFGHLKQSRNEKLQKTKNSKKIQKQITNTKNPKITKPPGKTLSIEHFEKMLEEDEEEEQKEKAAQKEKAEDEAEEASTDGGGHYTDVEEEEAEESQEGEFEDPDAQEEL